jgi:hypothetical protein
MLSNTIRQTKLTPKMSINSSLKSSSGVDTWKEYEQTPGWQIVRFVDGDKMNQFMVYSAYLDADGDEGKPLVRIVALVPYNMSISVWCIFSTSASKKLVVRGTVDFFSW